MPARVDAPVGIFDSGVGGLSVLRALQAELPNERFVYFADTGHAPYGERADAFVAQRTLAVATRLLEEQRIKALVVACNTATAAAIHLLRGTFPGLPVVGVEPALKPAIPLSQTGRIAVLATRGTLASAKFAALHDSLKAQAEFVLQPCDGLAAAIEAADAIKTIALCQLYTRTAGRFGTKPGQIDMLVLGCTHYPFAADALGAATGPGVRLLDTGDAVARQARRALASAGLLRQAGPGSIALLSTGSLPHLQDAARRWLGWSG